MKIISWNIARRTEPWRRLVESGADIALLQEAGAPPPDVAERVTVGASPWRTEGRGAWRAAVVQLSDRVRVEWLEPKRLDDAAPGEFAVSRLGTVAAAEVAPPSGRPIVVASLYAPWERPHTSCGSSWIYADASAHRVISDVATLIGRQAGHRILAAGDLNVLHGYGEGGSRYWAGRYETVFRRMEAMGLRFVGPQSPNGRRADPWPDELPRSSRNVPTYHSSRQTPATATRQLDFAFASDGLAERVAVRALNDPSDWGPSDHCRIEIQVDE